MKQGRLDDITDSDVRGQISAKCLKEFVRIAERCLLINQKRPTMAEVVVSLDNVLALQNKTSRSLRAAGPTRFGRVFDLFPFASNGENSAYGDSKLSSNNIMGNDHRNATFLSNQEPLVPVMLTQWRSHMDARVGLGPPQICIFYIRNYVRTFTKEHIGVVGNKQDLFGEEF